MKSMLTNSFKPPDKSQRCLNSRSVSEREDMPTSHAHSLTRGKCLCNRGDAVKSAWLHGSGRGEEDGVTDIHVISHIAQQKAATYARQSVQPKNAEC